ncbi:MaoC family dehydratase [Salinisphaera aquimarina]|uniref:MaoC family dehydratase n=1 Tax=Salinisphaera aquimarina TaxID=2094031 RepID=A0ABV7EM43_9GAMM
MRILENVEELQSLVGEEIGTSNWMAIDQERVNLFADATDDHQWIHVDIERAKKESPFGGPVAHGFLTLSLLPPLVNDIFKVEGVTTRVNYGLNKVRFVAPVLVGSRVRARVTLKSVEPRGEGRYMICNEIAIEIEGQDKPACLAQGLTLYIL